MKTVSGSVVSSRVVSLSNAARILSNFASSDNGASPAFAAYLNLASASFNELVHLHKEFKGSGPEHTSNIRLSSGTSNEEAVISPKKPHKHVLMTEEKQETSGKKTHKVGKRSGEKARELEGMLKIHDNKPKHKKRRDEGEESVGTQVKDSKKRKHKGDAYGGLENSEEHRLKKKKKKNGVHN